ncbi:MAG: T9SS type A sorting domain-containing protein [Ignavibacteria bacterium]|nr:T9SS type A sorting domain-containing protein [Ignavibacteria bacterium]
MKFVKNFLFVICSFLILLAASSPAAIAFEVKPGAVDFSNLNYNQSTMFGQDVLIAASEPEGPISGVKAANGTIWLAINDTTISTGRGILFYKSTNAGNNWSLHTTALQPAFIADQVKMLKAGDSTFCFFRIAGTIYRFNVVTNSFNTFSQSTAATQFDVVASSTNSLYLYYSTTTTVFRSSSIDGGFTWVGNANVSSNVKPVLGISATGDTVTVMYRASTGGDQSQILRFRYRETAPGTLATFGTSQVQLATGVNRYMYRPFRYANTEWIVYTEGDAPTTEIKCIISSDGGTTYGAPITISQGTTSNYPWFAGGISPNGAFIGIDMFFIKDSTGTSNDRVLYTGSQVSSPGFGGTRTPISNFGPVAGNYPPTAVELGNSDVGIAWVGQNGVNRNVYWDRYDYLTGIQQNAIVAETYDLKQNYPNPFNPSTTISFSLPKSDFVSLKIFDVSGKEVTELVNKNLTQGSYDVKFDASGLTSGVYFYKLITGNFVSTKKMMLIK